MLAGLYPRLTWIKHMDHISMELTICDIFDVAENIIISNPDKKI
jgi:hypothetical protein